MVRKNTEQKDLLVFSHLRWDYVYQRPQQILERMSKKHRIFYIEQPIDHVSLHLIPNTIKVNNNITVIQPRIDHNKFLEEYELFLKGYLKENNIVNPILWFYFPGFEKLTSVIDHSLIVYDCMDEHAAFKGGTKGLVNNELNLLKKADIVFTGGKSLYEAKKLLTKTIYCFPSSVDVDHFKKSIDLNTPVPDDVKDLEKPVVGYYGVIDERTNLNLLKEIADKMPEISFVMVGPVIYPKINAKKLPERKNLYFLGSKSYEELPNYLKAFDICMMPFAQNRSTKFISPTKTLEYMAALKPIISTPITDVVRDYIKMVYVIKGAGQFKKAVDYYLKESPEDKRKRENLMKNVLKNTSWDETASKMDEIIIKALENNNQE